MKVKSIGKEGLERRELGRHQRQEEIVEGCNGILQDGDGEREGREVLERLADEVSIHGCED